MVVPTSTDDIQPRLSQGACRASPSAGAPSSHLAGLTVQGTPLARRVGFRRPCPLKQIHNSAPSKGPFAPALLLCETFWLHMAHLCMVLDTSFDTCCRGSPFGKVSRPRALTLASLQPPVNKYQTPLGQDLLLWKGSLCASIFVGERLGNMANLPNRSLNERYTWRTDQRNAPPKACSTEKQTISDRSGRGYVAVHILFLHNCPLKTRPFKVLVGTPDPKTH